MVYVVEYLVRALKESRESKQMSQRALSKRVGMTQAQISKIENSAVDLKTSTLVELARSLDLEVMLVSRKHVPTVKSLSGSSGKADAGGQPPKPAYALDDDDDDD